MKTLYKELRLELRELLLQASVLQKVCWLLSSLDPNYEHKGGCIKHSDLLPLWTPYSVLNFFPWFRPLCGWSRTSQHD